MTFETGNTAGFAFKQYDLSNNFKGGWSGQFTLFSNELHAVNGQAYAALINQADSGWTVFRNMPNGHFMKWSSAAKDWAVLDSNGLVLRTDTAFISEHGDAVITRKWFDAHNTGGGGTNIYNSDGTLTGLRAVDLLGYSLGFHTTLLSGRTNSIGLDTSIVDLQATAPGGTELAEIQLSNTASNAQITIKHRLFGTDAGIQLPSQNGLGVGVYDGLGYGLFYAASSDYAAGLADGSLNPLLILPKEANDALYAPIGSTGTVTSITPGVGFLSHTPITTSGTMNVDTASTIVSKPFYNSVIGTATNTALSGKVPTTRTVAGFPLSSNVTLGTLTFGTHLTSGGSSYNGSTGVTITSDATNAATASTIMSRDANANSIVNNILENGTSTNTTNGTTTLTVSSSASQYFTGTAGQTVVMPVVSTLSLYQKFSIINIATGTVTVQSSGGNTIGTVPPNSRLEVQCISLSGTSAASWQSFLSGAVLNYLPLTTTANTTVATGNNILNFTTVAINAFQINGGTINAGASSGTSVILGKSAAANGIPANSTYLGYQAGYWLTSGSSTIIGYNAGTAGGGSFTSLTHGTLIGENSNVGANSLTNAMAIGYNSIVNNSNETVIGNNSVNTTYIYGSNVINRVPVAINATATATAAQFAQGYITSTSAAATTITTPTASALATRLNATQGTTCFITIDNTAGANTVTLALGSGFTLLNDITGSTTLTVVSGTAGVATWKITFASTSAATISRIE
jgi:hypothetical protein